MFERLQKTKKVVEDPKNQKQVAELRRVLSRNQCLIEGLARKTNFGRHSNFLPMFRATLEKMALGINEANGLLRFGHEIATAWNGSSMAEFADAAIPSRFAAASNLEHAFFGARLLQTINDVAPLLPKEGLRRMRACECDESGWEPGLEQVIPLAALPYAVSQKPENGMKSGSMVDGALLEIQARLIIGLSPLF